MDPCNISAIQQQWEAAFMAHERAAAQAAKDTRDMLRKLTQQLADAQVWKEKAEKAEEQMALYEKRSRKELELSELFDNEIQKLHRWLEGTEAGRLQEDILELQNKLRQAEEERDHNYKRLLEELDLREPYDQEIVKLRNLAWDRGEELERLQDSLKQETDYRSKLEWEVLELRQSLSRIQDEKTALEATLQTQTDTSQKLEKELLGLRNALGQLQGDVDHRCPAGDGTELSVILANSLSPVFHQDGHPPAPKRLGSPSQTNDLLEHVDDSISCLYPPQLFERSEPSAVIANGGGSRGVQLKVPVPRTSETSVPAMSAELHEEDISCLYPPLERNEPDTVIGSGDGFPGVQLKVPVTRGSEESVQDKGTELDEGISCPYPPRVLERSEPHAVIVNGGGSPEVLLEVPVPRTIEKSVESTSTELDEGISCLYPREVLERSESDALIMNGDGSPEVQLKVRSRATCEKSVRATSTDLVEGISCLYPPQFLERREPDAVIVNGDGSPGAQLKIPVPRTSEKSVQASSTELEEKDILIQHLKLSMEAVLKELEVSKSLYGFVV